MLGHATLVSLDRAGIADEGHNMTGKTAADTSYRVPVAINETWGNRREVTSKERRSRSVSHMHSKTQKCKHEDNTVGGG